MASQFFNQKMQNTEHTEKLAPYGDWRSTLCNWRLC